MKAAMIEKPGILVVIDIPVPKVGEYDLLCEMLYGATCAGTDQHLISGRMEVEYPAVLGHESIGRVIEVGKKVRNFKKGDIITRVGVPASPMGDFHIAWGGFSEYGIAKDYIAMCEDRIPKDQWDSYRINQIVPDDIDPAKATMFITWRETLSYITRMGIKQNTGIFIIGTGANGLAFANHARNLGCSDIVISGSSLRKDIAFSIGCTDFYDYKAEDALDIISGKYTDGFDFIIDAVGKKGLADSSLRSLRPGGTIGIYGIDDLGSCVLNPTNSKGTFTFYNDGYDEEETHLEILKYMREKKLDASNWLDMKNIYSLDDINKAYQAVGSRKAIKALVKLHN